MWGPVGVRDRTGTLDFGPQVKVSSNMDLNESKATYAIGTKDPELKSTSGRWVSHGATGQRGG
jgi:hypothetical protein